ncbi:hypothetical protein NPIL_668531 [Nephila pilipes]|uniref:Uncharacterized protein n=1 Tax=Nephila pilipes TaxID=299642 RepID=A0A8X6UC30_NEPPI|nr:hypothetical protein NPIL_668531 [Nephila pilipes]
MDDQSAVEDYRLQKADSENYSTEVSHYTSPDIIDLVPDPGTGANRQSLEGNVQYLVYFNDPSTCQFNQ